MGDIVSAVATSHVLMSKQGAEAAAKRVVDGMLRIGRHVRNTKPDVLFVISNDHMFNIGPGVGPAFLLACGEKFVPFGEMDIPKKQYAGDPQFATALISFLAEHGAAVESLQSLNPDHGTAIPLLFANPERNIKIVPLLVNYDNSPPEPADCWQLGSLLRDFITRERPQEERIAIIAAGGLSHWVGYADNHINEDFDTGFMRAIRSGAVTQWRDRSADSIRQEAGNGGLEVMSWLTMAAAVPDAYGEIVYYEPMPSWLTGMGGVIMQL